MNSREVTLGDVCEIKQGKYLSPGQMESQPSEDAPVPVIGGNGILGYTTSSTFSFPLPLVTCRGSRCGLMQWAEPPTWISNNAMAVYFKDGLGDDFFLYQYLLQSSFDDVTTGSAQPQITVSNLSLKKMVLPELKVQQAISRLMMNIEKKIEFNTSISRTLEEIAHAIFKSWFIDFDPVIAKMVGEKPIGMDDATAALFPDAMEDSELGQIPKGWVVAPLGNHLTVIKGKSYKSSELAESETALVTLKSFLRGGGYRLDGLKEFAGQYKPEQVVEPGELIVSFTDVTQSADVIGKPALVLPNPNYSRLVASLDIGIVRTKGQSVGKLFLYELFLSNRFKSHVEGYTNGTTVLHLGKGALEEFRTVLPREQLIYQFEKLADSFRMQIQASTLENLKFQEIRDALLPRLISGELQIPEEMLVS